MGLDMDQETFKCPKCKHQNKYFLVCQKCGMFNTTKAIALFITPTIAILFSLFIIVALLADKESSIIFIAIFGVIGFYALSSIVKTIATVGAAYKEARRIRNNTNRKNNVFFDDSYINIDDS